MITSQSALNDVQAAPFRAFRIHTASGRTFPVRHPEMVEVLKNNLLVFSSVGDSSDVPDEREGVSLMPAERISHIEAPVSRSHQV